MSEPPFSVGLIAFGDDVNGYGILGDADGRALSFSLADSVSRNMPKPDIRALGVDARLVRIVDLWDCRSK